jgi:hypothetical protein
MQLLFKGHSVNWLMCFSSTYHFYLCKFSKIRTWGAYLFNFLPKITNGKSMKKKKHSGTFANERKYCN